MHTELAYLGGKEFTTVGKRDLEGPQRELE